MFPVVNHPILSSLYEEFFIKSHGIIIPIQVSLSRKRLCIWIYDRSSDKMEDCITVHEQIRQYITWSGPANALELQPQKPMTWWVCQIVQEGWLSPTERASDSAHFGLPWVRPWGNRGKCYMDGKRIQCLSNASRHVPIYLQPFTSYGELYVGLDRSMA